MTLLLLFSPSALDFDDGAIVRVREGVKKRFKKKFSPPPEIKEEPEPKAAPIPKKPATGNPEYLHFLKEEIKSLNDKINTLASVSQVLEKSRLDNKLRKLEQARHALDLEYYECMQMEIEEDFAKLMFFMLA